MATSLTPQQKQDRLDADLEVLHNFLHSTASTVMTDGGAIATLSFLASRSNTQFLELAASDLSTALVAASSVAYDRTVRAGSFNTIRASLLQASSSGPVTVDVKVNGASVFSTLLTIDANEKSSLTAAIPCVVSNGTVADDDEITIDIVTAGAGAKGLIVRLLMF